MKKFQLSIQQVHAITEEPERYVKRNTMQVYIYLCLKGGANPTNGVTDANDPIVKSNCAGVGCAAATLNQVISVCVVPVRVKH